MLIDAHQSATQCHWLALGKTVPNLLRVTHGLRQEGQQQNRQPGCPHNLDNSVWRITSVSVAGRFAPAFRSVQIPRNVGFPESVSSNGTAAVQFPLSPFHDRYRKERRSPLRK